ncbi:uncharacterized protein [Apostichopus japonicus]|uniref:uncharacterized protein n=1 Tax=Stichopus japonicus TaxID=307972 RepID=UPI003AB80E2A
MWDLQSVAELRLVKMLDVTYDDVAFCPSNCSGNGDCMNGTCLCAVQYQGGGCQEKNKSYFISFSVIFYVLSSITTIQLIMCIKSEYQKMKNPSVWKACRVTTQKLLYLFVICASLSRGLYFTIQDSIPIHWADNIMSLYYLLLFSGCTLVVCFWAEMFHIQDRGLTNPGFLSKSLRFFTIFNLTLYSLTLAQFIASVFVENPHKLTKYLNGSLAALFIIEVVFFLAYGVEVFFKLKGAFKEEIRFVRPYPLHGSRLGLVFQGALQILTAFFLMMSVTEAKWKDSVPQPKKNYYDVIFRVVELGVALWFPCVLWNSRSPEKLWILNPSIIVQTSNDEEQVPVDRGEREALNNSRRRINRNYQATVDTSRDTTGPDCWICYDGDNQDAGPLIQPCCCSGDVAYVHHECLRKWLLESVDDSEASHCKVCKTPYQLSRGVPRLYRGFDMRTSFRMIAMLVMMTVTPLAVYFVLQNHPLSSAGIAGIGGCVLVEMLCLKCLGYSIKNVYNRAKIFSLVIVGKTAHSISQEVTNDELVVRRESQSARRATIVSLTPHDERLREDVAKETHQVEIVQTDSKPTLSEQNERTHPL